MKTIYLLRHSITEGVEKKLCYGATDLALTEDGHALCQTLRGKFELPANIAFGTTGMLRTIQTLKGLFGDVPYEEFPELREMNVGVLEMHRYDELSENAVYQQWISDQTGDFCVPGGESANMMQKRVIAQMKKLAVRPGSDLFIVCHGGTICHSMTHFFPEDCESFYDWSPKPCEGYALTFDDLGAPKSWKKL